jgi:hypothetical protein
VSLASWRQVLRTLVPCALPVLLLAGGLGGGCCTLSSRAAREAGRPFPENAVADREIAAGLREAANSGRRTLLMFGANWCGDSRAMYWRLTEDPRLAPLVRQAYVLVLIDVGRPGSDEWDSDVVRRYGRPFKDRGIPAFVVLDSDGRQLTTPANNPLRDSDHRRPSRVRRFLRAWAPALFLQDRHGGGVVLGMTQTHVDRPPSAIQE